MKLIAPDYYHKFSCINKKCKHNCCIGWEIDIDDKTHEYYKTIHGEIGEKLHDNISTEETPHFILGHKDRCPFLDENNLCELILALGEDCLCDICSDHPRFRNFYDNRTEIGLGLCCEAAGELILKNKEKVSLIEIENDGDEGDDLDVEEYFFNLRSEIFDIVQNRSLSLNERINMLISDFDIYFPNLSPCEWADKYRTLERLDNSWDNELDALEKLEAFNNELQVSELDTVFEQLLIYFLYRHMSDGIYDGSLKERIAFSVISTKIIQAMYDIKLKENSNTTVDDIIDTARRYSAEIEYSEENTEALLNIFEITN